MSLVVRAVYFDAVGGVELVFMDTADVRADGQLCRSQTLTVGGGLDQYQDEVAAIVGAVGELLRDALEDFHANPVEPAGMAEFGGG